MFRLLPKKGEVLVYRLYEKFAHSKSFQYQDMKVLVLGDGNFSFSLALARQLQAKERNAQEYLGSVEPATLVSTSFDSQTELLEKYHDFKDISNHLQV
jgi:hypothetical protein